MQDDECFDLWCQQHDLTGVSIYFRLAPEHPYPAALDDCYAGLAWVVRHGAAYGIDGTKVGIGGASAGAGLAATKSLDPTLVRDHSADDARSLCFTGATLDAPLDVIGLPKAVLDVQASVLPLNLVVKLSAVAANGALTLITSGWVDLTTTAVAGQRAQMTVVLRATAFRVEAGARLRVAVSCADFPRIWPTPVPATL